MNTILDFYKELYEEIPSWVEQMYKHNNNMLSNYTRLRNEALKDGIYSSKEKDLFIAVMNAGRYYEKSMNMHLQAAIKKNAGLEEVIEYMLLPYVINGDKSIAFIEKALGIFERTLLNVNSNNGSIEKIIEKLRNQVEVVQTQHFLGELANTSNKEHSKFFEAGLISKKNKLIALLAISLVKLDKQLIDYWSDEAFKEGITESEIAELGFVAMITAGIPIWFEISEILQKWTR